MARFEAFWEVMCDYMHYLWLGVMTALFLFILALMGLYFAEPGTGSFAINLINIVLILGFGTAVSGMFWVCDQRRKREF